MATKRCEVPGCPETRLRTPRLCNEHTIQWFQSPEETETRKRVDYIGPWKRWLMRTGAAKGLVRAVTSH
jgi:hypothetical protein